LRYQHILYIAEKYIQWATIPLLTIRVCLHSFSCYCLQKHEKCREIPREFVLTAVQGHPRSSILVSLESPYV